MSGYTRVSRYQKGKTKKVKTNLDLLEQEIVSGSGICWAICKSAPHADNHANIPPLCFYRPNQQRQSTEGLYDLSNSSNCDDLECPWWLFPSMQPFSSAIFHICGTSCGPCASSELIVLLLVAAMLSIVIMRHGLPSKKGLEFVTPVCVYCCSCAVLLLATETASEECIFSVARWQVHTCKLDTVFEAEASQWPAVKCWLSTGTAGYCRRT